MGHIQAAGLWSIFGTLSPFRIDTTSQPNASARRYPILNLYTQPTNLVVHLKCQLCTIGWMTDGKWRQQPPAGRESQHWSRNSDPSGVVSMIS